MLILIVSLCAPLIANDKPLYVHYQGEHLLPMLQAYPETRFGGDFETPTNYHDPAVLKLIHQNGDLWMPLIKYGEQTLVLDTQMPHPDAPSFAHPLGTDQVGRDVLARLLYALRISLIFGMGLSLIGSILRCLQAY